MGLPRNLIQLIRDGQLEAKLEEAYRELDRLNDLLDAWEAANPSLAAQTPWYEGREAWKSSGRPRPPWYEALYWHEETVRVPVTRRTIATDLLCSSWKPEYAIRYKPKAQALYQRRRAEKQLAMAALEDK